MEYFFHSTGKILHVYDDDDIDRLNVLLTKQNSFEALAPICKRNSSCESVWLIHVPNVSEPVLKDFFRRTPLRLDSQTYAVTQGSNTVLSTAILNNLNLSKISGLQRNKFKIN